MTNKKVCPLCGSDKISQTERHETICESFGGCRELSLFFDSCELCGTEGDFSNKNDELIKEVIKELKSEAVKNILKDFSEQKFNFAGMERALELPQRTLAKWKNGSASPSAAGVTLLKFLRLFPWLLVVAEKNFDFEVSQSIHIKDRWTGGRN